MSEEGYHKWDTESILHEFKDRADTGNHVGAFDSQFVVDAIEHVQELEEALDSIHTHLLLIDEIDDEAKEVERWEALKDCEEVLDG